ncbi:MULTISPECIES: ABC transporter permease [Microbacterium]|uniref:ABC transporter permease n=1 Tax=Microbacterium hominis TaxID=162426 RepID=A0A2K9D3I8_9MICO|nr:MULTISPECIES: ABC transporter permease [Microbacterium]AUG28285.1 ABC transporter permease [Microbacterium hominis]QOC26999.1 ABC transporter permease [Microbacterium hominis]QOC28161.1 ABC transporter permease [Microbacterium hominis]QYF96666.1 ABC transporter permease [Microbacterium sp. PAMC21962]
MTTTRTLALKDVPRRRRPSLEPVWRREPRKLTSLLISVGSAVALIAVWAWVTRPGGAISPLFLPSPGDVWDAAVRLIERPYLGSTLGGHIVSSLTTVIAGWLLAAAVGIPLGVWIGWSRKARWTVYPIFQLLRPIPPIAWIPLALVWFGIGDPSRVFVVFVSAIVPWTLNSIHAVTSVEPTLVNAARVLGAPPLTILGRVVIPTAMATLLAGGQIAMGNAWTTVIAAELLGALSGLGYVALNSSRTLDTDILLVSMITIGLIGALLSALMKLLTPGGRR